MGSPVVRRSSLGGVAGGGVKGAKQAMRAYFQSLEADEKFEAWYFGHIHELEKHYERSPVAILNQVIHHLTR
jgi:hypothetical protein